MGSRMGALTKEQPKSMVRLYNGESILERQLRILEACGIKDIIITTGYQKEKVEKAANQFSNLHLTFVHNPLYDKTNYIYSMYLAREHLKCDMLSLHGDLVFDQALIEELLQLEEKSVCLIHKKKKLPEKDFKGRIQSNQLKEVSIHIFDEDCYALQPLYKLSQPDMEKWMEAVCDFVHRGERNVYAENALNTILDTMNLIPFSYEKHYIDEIDHVEDFERVSKEIQSFDNKK